MIIKQMSRQYERNRGGKSAINKCAYDVEMYNRLIEELSLR